MAPGKGEEGELEAQGCKRVRVKNFWGPGDGYQGINSVVVTAAGFPFELQFHTPESIAMKEEECHACYELFRVEVDAHKRMQCASPLTSCRLSGPTAVGRGCRAPLSDGAV